MDTLDRYPRPFLLTGMKLFQWILTGPTWRVFLLLAAPGTLVALLSIPFGVASIPATHATGFEQNVGYLYRANWTWAYIVAWPVSLLLLRRLSEAIRSSVQDLEDMRILVGVKNPDANFGARLEMLLGSSATRVVIWSFVGVIAFTVFDTMDIARGYVAFAGGVDPAACTYQFSEADWSVAFATDCWSQVAASASYPAPGIVANTVFTTFAFLLQVLMFASYVIWVLRLTQFFFAFSSSLQGEDFRLDPFFDDPMQRLGLGPLGKTYNLFLTLILIFETYVAAHRLQQVALIRGQPILEYLRELMLVGSQPWNWFNAEVHQFGTLDVGTVVLLVVVVLPITIVCWFPLFRLRSYLGERKLELAKELAMKRARADEEGDEEGAERYARKVKLLAEANLWPNGDSAAQRFLLAMIVIWLGAIFPVVFVSVALGAFGMFELIRFIAWGIDWVQAKRAGPAT